LWEPFAAFHQDRLHPANRSITTTACCCCRTHRELCEVICEVTFSSHRLVTCQQKSSKVDVCVWVFVCLSRQGTKQRKTACGPWRRFRSILGWAGQAQTPDIARELPPVDPRCPSLHLHGAAKVWWQCVYLAIAPERTRGCLAFW
jgi:hypothetical protein